MKSKDTGAGKWDDLGEMVDEITCFVVAVQLRTQDAVQSFFIAEYFPLNVSHSSVSFPVMVENY